MNEDNSQFWVRISYGTVRYVINYIKYDTQSLADPQEEEYVPTSSGVVVARSRAKAKPQPRESTGTTTIPFSERAWIDIEPSKLDLESYNLSKTVINLLRHNQKLHREQDGAIQFYKIRFHLRDYPLPIQNWSDDRWLACLAASGGSKRRYQYCSDNLGINHLSPCSSRTFWGQSHWSCVTRQRVDWTWSISLHLPCRKQFQSFFNSQQWIDTWRPEFKQRTIFVLLACWSKKRRPQRSREYWLLCTASCLIRAKHLEKASGYGILDWYWSWNYQRRIEVLSDKIERNHPLRGTSSKLHCESWKIEKRRKIVWKAIFVSSSTTEDIFEARSQLE